VNGTGSGLSSGKLQRFLLLVDCATSPHILFPSTGTTSLHILWNI